VNIHRKVRNILFNLKTKCVNYLKQFSYFCPKLKTAVYDEFGFDESLEQRAEDIPTGPHIPMRAQFPAAGEDYLGGQSDGWEYRTVFAGAKLAYTYEMVKQFLQEEGYGEIPIPATWEDLKLFRRPKHPQLQMFADRGYIHNPIKILFLSGAAYRNTLVLCVYNEALPDHLLRFHGVLRAAKTSEVNTPPADAPLPE
jgi:hypothetical protein